MGVWGRDVKGESSWAEKTECINSRYNLKNLPAGTRMGRIRKENMRIRTDLMRDLPARTYRRVLRWTGHTQKADEGRYLRRVMYRGGSGRRYAQS